MASEIDDAYFELNERPYAEKAAAAKNWKQLPTLHQQSLPGKAPEFWWLEVDLKALAAGSPDAAQVELSFTDYAIRGGYLHEKNYRIPQFADTKLLSQLLTEIRERAAELTAGFGEVVEDDVVRAAWDLGVPGAEEARDFWNAEIIARLDAMVTTRKGKENVKENTKNSE